MSEPPRLSPRERGRLRREKILEAMVMQKRRLTTQEIADLVDEKYGHVYQDLRRLCGSFTLTYNCQFQESVCAGPEYPVIWHPWYQGSGKVTWELNPDYQDPTMPTAEAEEAAVRSIMRSFLAVG
jgi:hypothetical protein